MFDLLVLLLVIKLGARNDIFKFCTYIFCLKFLFFASQFWFGFQIGSVFD